jgi:hypothetical protein
MKAKITAAAFLFIAVLFFDSCKNKTPESKKENTSTEQATNAKYQCTMRCEGEKTYDKPGQCPVCNMDLKKVGGVNESYDKNHQPH